MALSVGIAGLPNVGKSTLLNALTQAHVDASNYPFCTIEQNVGITAVPDPDLKKLEQILRPQEVAPATIRVVDIAGLVAGASRGEGLGNKFLGHIRDVEAILHMVRCFEDANVAHSPGPPDPVRDVDIVETEFLLADLETAQRAHDKWKTVLRTGKGAGREEEAVFGRAVQALGEGKRIIELELHNEEPRIIAEARFLTSKPCLYVANTDDDDPTGESPLVQALKRAKGAENVLPVSVRIEEEISELPPEDQGEFLKGLGLEETALNLVVAGCKRLLNLITFYTVANNKLAAWHLPHGGTAVEAAGKIHSDMATGFIKAEIMTLTELLEHGSCQALHDKGLLRAVGRDHVIEDKDVLYIHFRA